MWTTKQLNDIYQLKQAIDAIGDLDIEQELSNHDALQTQNE
jgi:hypothetical protein